MDYCCWRILQNSSVIILASAKTRLFALETRRFNDFAEWVPTEFCHFFPGREFLPVLPVSRLSKAAREYWMICRRPGFLALVTFGSSPTPYPLLPSVYSAGRIHRKIEKERQLANGRGGRGWGRSQIIRRGDSLPLCKYSPASTVSDIFHQKELPTSPGTAER